MDTLLAAAVPLCLLQSGMFSGLNLALFRFSKLRLEAESEAGSREARAVLALRADSNRLLATILWGNVAVNCLLTILLDSVFAGVTAFVVSTVGITLCGEIAPQAWFSRNALKVGALFAPFVRFYMVLLYPVTKPTAWFLDQWLGPEEEQPMGERDLEHLIRLHVEEPKADVGRVEGVGAINFLSLDDRAFTAEAEILDPDSVIRLEDLGSSNGLPRYEAHPADPFLRKVHASGHKWVVLTDGADQPIYVLDADGFLRSALLDGRTDALAGYCHRPHVVRDPEARLERVLEELHAHADEADVIDRDVVLLWGGERRILTGADLLGTLLRGASPGEKVPVREVERGS